MKQKIIVVENDQPVWVVNEETFDHNVLITGVVGGKIHGDIVFLTRKSYGSDQWLLLVLNNSGTKKATGYTWGKNQNNLLNLIKSLPSGEFYHFSTPKEFFKWAAENAEE